MRAILAPLIPVAKSGGRPQYVCLCGKCDRAIFYILCGGCSWRMMPHEFPAWKTVYHYFRLWRLSGVWGTGLLTRGEVNLLHHLFSYIA